MTTRTLRLMPCLAAFLALALSTLSLVVESAMRRIIVKRNAPSQLLVVLLSAVLFAPIIPIPHGGSFQGIRVFIIQAAAFCALALLMTRASVSGSSFRSVISRGPGLPLLLLLAWAAISFLSTAPSNAHARGIGQVELLRIGTGIVIYFAAVFGCRSRVQLRTISMLLIGGAILAAMAAMSTSSLLSLKPARGAFGEEQLMGAFLATLFPVAAVFALKSLFTVKEKLTSRLIKAAGMVIVLCALLLTGERMSWISGTLGTLLAIRLAFWARMITLPVTESGSAKARRWFAPVLAMAAVIGINAAFICCVPVVHHRLEIAQARVSVQDRFKLWSACAGMIRERPLTGWGIGSFPLKAGSYVSSIPTAAQVEQYGVTLSSVAHNEYLQMAAELGLAGLGLYLAVLAGFFLYGVQALKSKISGTRRWLLLASLVGVASQSINAVSNPGWHFSDISPLLWLLMGMGMAAATPRVINEPRETHLVIELPTLPYRSMRFGQVFMSTGLGLSLILASVSVSLGKNPAVAYYYYLPIISNVTATPNPLPIGGGILKANATVADGGAGVSNVFAYLYEDANYLTNQFLGSGADTYTGNFNIPPNGSATTAHVWTVQFYAYNNRNNYATASASATQPANTLNVPSQYPTIQAGVDAAQNGSTVLVADGTYSGPGNRDIDFHGKNINVISQHGAANTIIDCGGYKSTDGSGNHRGFYIHSGEMNAAIRGFTVRNGYESFGGGIENDNRGGTITLTNCTITNNTADSGEGGGVNNFNFSGNGSITLNNCTATGNVGEGVSNYNQSNGTITLNNCTTTGNISNFGGGVFNSNYKDGGTITLTNCTVTGNSAQQTGGGVYNYIGNSTGKSAITLTNCAIDGNSAQGNQYGGGIGGGIYNDNYGNGAITLTNCTVAANTASIGGGGVYNSNGPITLTNDILYGDTGGEVANDPSGTLSAMVTYCDVQGGHSGTGNIDRDPLFVNAAAGDLHLKPGSPCLGKGTPNGAPATDKDGRTRPNPPSMGAYELAATLAIPDQYPTIQSAVAAARSGDTVLVESGTYTGPGNVDWDFGGKDVTVKSADGAANTIIDCGGKPSSDGTGNHRGFYVHSGETNAVIDGITIKNGYESYVAGVADSGYGGSICVDGSGVSIKNCIFTGSTATKGGGGVAIIGKGHHSITLTNCVFTKNTAPNGGGVYTHNDSGAVALTNCTVTGNAASNGGGVFNQNSQDNGAIALTGCSVSGNTAQGGGGVYNENDTGGDTITLINCSVSGNAAPFGGGIYDFNSSSDDMILLINDIVYGDPGGEASDNALTSSATTVSFSDIQGGHSGTGNIDADPLFVNAATGDLHLKPGSPCLGKGTPNGAPATDKDGNPRPNPPSMGAYDSTLKITNIELTLPQFVQAGKSNYYLDEKAYLKGSGYGTIIGHWVVGGSNAANVAGTQIDVSSGYWTQGAEIKLPWDTIKSSNFSIKFVVEMPAPMETPETVASVTGFRPDLNGWSFDNSFTFYTLPGYFWNNRKFEGECLGFVATAQYYYAHPPLPSIFLGYRQINTAIYTAQRKGNAWANNNDASFPSYKSEVDANIYEAGLIQQQLHLFQPALVGLSAARGVSGNGHAVLAVAGFSCQSLIDASNADFGASNIVEVKNVQDFAIYDPNYSGQVRGVYLGDIAGSQELKFRPVSDDFHLGLKDILSISYRYVP